MKKIGILLFFAISFSLITFNGILYADDQLLDSNQTLTEEVKPEEPISPEPEERQRNNPEIQPILPKEIQVEPNTMGEAFYDIFQTPVQALAANEIIVTNFTEFKNAIEIDSNGYTTVYLGSDIIMTSGVAIPSNKANLIIDGTNPNTGQRYTLTEMGSSYNEDTINLHYNSSASGIITVRNIDIQGKNYFGNVYIAADLGIVVIYDNVTYYGPELAYNTYGKVIIRNSTITIPESISGGSECEYVAEVHSVDLEGNVTINHTPSTASYPFTVFRFYGTGSMLTFKQGSNVNITTNTGLNDGFYGDAITSVLFENNATLIGTQTADEMDFYSGVGQSFTMQTGSSMVLNRTPSTFSKAAIGMNSTSGSFTMNGASISIISVGDVDSLGSPIMTIPASNLTNSTIYIETKGNQSVRSIYGRGNSSLTSSIITAKINGKEVATNKTIDLTGYNLTMQTASINFNINNTNAGAFLACAKAGLTDSSINTNISGTITTPSTADITVTEIDLNNSTLKGIYQNNSGGLLRATANSPSSLVARNGSSLESTVTGACATVLSTAGTASIQKGSKISIDMGRATSSAAYPILSGGNLTLGDDSRTSVIVRSGSLNGVIRLSLSTANPSFTVDNPKSFLAYAPTATKILHSASSANFYLKTQQINQWTTNNTPTTSGTLDHLPSKRFAKADGTNYVIQGTNGLGIAGVTTVTSSNFVSGVDGLNPLGNLSFLSSNAKIMSMGKMSVTINPITQHGTSATGTSEGSGTVRLTYKSGGVSSVSNANANSLGNYTLTTSPIDLEPYTLAANWNYLYANLNGTPVPAGSLRFIDVPTTMSFGTTNIPTKVKIINRNNPSWNIQIQDDRAATANWKLMVKVTTPLTPGNPEKPSINNAFIFIDPGNVVHSLSSTPLGIRTNKGGSQNTTVNWIDSQGVLLRINPGLVYSGITYTGTIQWTLQDAP